MSFLSYALYYFAQKAGHRKETGLEQKIFDLIEADPVIAAIKDDEGLKA